MNTKYEARPTAAHSKAGRADTIACQAAHFARLAGADTAECAAVYLRTYKHEMAQG